MNIEEILDSQITQDQLEERILREGMEVFKIIQTPGWDLICGALIMAKINAEKARKKAVSKEPNREVSLYWNGIVDGIEEAKEAIYSVVKTAQDLRETKESQKQMEEM